MSTVVEDNSLPPVSEQIAFLRSLHSSIVTAQDARAFVEKLSAPKYETVYSRLMTFVQNWETIKVDVCNFVCGGLNANDVLGAVNEADADDQVSKKQRLDDNVQVCTEIQKDDVAEDTSPNLEETQIQNATQEEEAAEEESAQPE